MDRKNTLRLITGDIRLDHVYTSHAEGFAGTSGGTATVHGLRVDDEILSVFQFSDGTDLTAEFVSPVEDAAVLEQDTGGTDLTDEVLHVTVKRG
jgi:hypothetical protein